MERKGLVWVVSKEDAPGPVLVTDPRRISPGTVNSIGISLSTVDRSSLDVEEGQECLKRNETFELIHGVQNTYINCMGLSLHGLYPNCSLAVYMGYNQRN